MISETWHCSAGWGALPALLMDFQHPWLPLILDRLPQCMWVRKCGCQMDGSVNSGLAGKQGKPSWERGDISCCLHTNIGSRIFGLGWTSKSPRKWKYCYRFSSSQDRRKESRVAGWEPYVGVFQRSPSNSLSDPFLSNKHQLLNHMRWFENTGTSGWPWPFSDLFLEQIQSEDSSSVLSLACWQWMGFITCKLSTQPWEFF